MMPSLLQYIYTSISYQNCSNTSYYMTTTSSTVVQFTNNTTTILFLIDSRELRIRLKFDRVASRYCFTQKIF